MPKAYSIDLRERVVNAYLGSERSQEEVAELFNIGSRTLSRYLDKQRETGNMTPGVSPGRPPILTEEDYPLVKEIVSSQPDITLENLSAEVARYTSKWVSSPVMCRICQKLNLRRKKKSFHATEADLKEVKKNAKTLLQH